MPSFNKVILAGNLTRDPELRYTPKGTAIAKICVAISRKWKSESGELREETTFVDCDCFGKTAETVGQYFKKGKPILVEGRLKLDQWDDKQTGQKRQKLGVVLETFQFLDSGHQGGGSQCAPPAGREENGRVTQVGREDLPPGTRPATDPQGAAENPQPDGPEDDVPF